MLQKVIQPGLTGRQNWVWTYGKTQVERVVIGANPGSAAYLVLYDYNQAEGNIAPQEGKAIVHIAVPTDAAPRHVDIGAVFLSGLTVRGSAAGLEVYVVIES